MIIVILDGFTTVREDLNWQQLEEFGTVIAYDRTPAELTVERSKDAEIILTNKVVIDAEVMNQLPKLRYIGVLATGYNVVDLEEARKRGIVVTNIPAYSSDSVAQIVFAHLLNVVGRIDHYAQQNRAGRWNNEPDVCYLDHSWRELSGKTFGIIGMGNIGRVVARIAEAFGMHVISASARKDADPAALDNLLHVSDVISLHCPLTDTTHHLINKERLAMMKPSAIIINTGRGPLVCDEDMAEALSQGVIASYCTDVVTQEPPRDGNVLFSQPNCYVTPHFAWATVEARQRLINICTENIRSFINGSPINTVC